MIKYTYKDKELKVPVGIGNITNESFEEGFALGYEEGFALGYPSGVTAQKAKLISDDFKYNGIYEREDGWNEIEIDVQPACNNGSVEMDAIEQTFTSDDITPEGPDGEQLYFGSIAALKALFEEKGVGFNIRVKRWDDEAHSDYTEIGIIHKENGVFYWRNTQSASTETAIDDIPNTWMQGDANGELFLRNDGYNLFMYETFPYGLLFMNGWGQEMPEEEMIFSTDFYAISAISVNAQAVYDDGYIDGHDDGFVEGHTSGVTDGFNIGYPSGHTDGYASGYENGNTDGFNIGYPSGVTDGFATGHESGYTDGFAAGYPSGVTDGYASGYATGQVDGATAEHNKIATSAISLSFSGNGSWYQSGDVYCKEVYVSVPMFWSLFIVLKGENISLTAADIISITTFDISETIIRTLGDGVGIFVRGRGRQQAGGGNDRIVITIPTSVYSQWTLSSCDLVAFNANSDEPFDSGIQTTPVDFRATTGESISQIIISLYDN